MPVHPLAVSTAGKTLLRQINIRGHFRKNAFLIYILEGCVALETTGEDVEILQAKGSEDLAYLLFIVIARDQKAARAGRKVGEAGVPCEDHPSFLAGDPQDFAVFELVGIKDVKAQNPQPAGEFTHHDVRNKPHSACYNFRRMWGNK